MVERVWTWSNVVVNRVRTWRRIDWNLEERSEGHHVTIRTWEFQLHFELSTLENHIARFKTLFKIAHIWKKCGCPDFQSQVERNQWNQISELFYHTYSNRSAGILVIPSTYLTTHCENRIITTTTTIFYVALKMFS